MQLEVVQLLTAAPDGAQRAHTSCLKFILKEGKYLAAFWIE